jgi:hypothetical protein
MRKELPAAAVAGLIGLSTTALAAANPVVSAFEKTAKAKTAVVSLSGAVASATAKSSIRGRIEQRGTSMHAKMSVSSPVGRQVVEMIALTARGRYVLYLRSPALLPQLPSGKRWIRVDAKRSVQQLGFDVSSFTQASPRSFARLERTIVDTKRVGAASVGAETATHYLVHVDLAKAAAGQPALSAQLSQLAGSGVNVLRFPLHVWVGRDGRIKQMRETLSVRTAAQRVTTSLTFRYVALNAAVRIVAPPRSQVVDG